MKQLLSIILFLAVLPLASQIESYDEMNIEFDSTLSNYKPSGRNYAVVRSKRGNSGVNRTPRADSAASLPINEVVLVFTETTAEDLAEREEANRERWENLLYTYPEFFAEGVTFKNVCQCNRSGDEASLKQTQGFYIYYTGAEPPPPEPAKPVAKAKVEEKIAEAPPKEKPAERAGKPAKEPDIVANEPAKVAEKEKMKPAETTREPEKPAVKEEAPAAVEIDDERAPVTEPVKPRVRKPAVATKGRKARDPKACRPPCYEGGDDDLNNFFIQNIKLSKKQKRKGKHMNAQVRIQLNNDGSVKKTMVTGENEALNMQVQDALKAMNNWNSAVKNGTSIKSEVKINLKYDRESKSLKPFDVMTVPRLSPKCRCMSDSELFGD